MSTDNNSTYICSPCELLSFKQLIEEPNRVTPNRSSILDHIASTSQTNRFEAGLHKLFIFDHYMEFCVRKFEGALKKDSKIVQTRSMKNFDRDAFFTDITGICWEQGLNETDAVEILVAHHLYFPLLFPLYRRHHH